MCILLLVAVAFACVGGAYSIPCHLSTSCGTCVGNSTCDWCYGSSPTSSTDGSCVYSPGFTSSCTTKNYASITCPSQYCGAHSSCGGCTTSTQLNCEWCPSTSYTSSSTDGVCQYFGSGCLTGSALVSSLCPTGLWIYSAVGIVFGIVLPIAFCASITIAVIVCVRRRRYAYQQTLVIAQPYGAYQPQQVYQQYPPQQQVYVQGYPVQQQQYAQFAQQ